MLELFLRIKRVHVRAGWRRRQECRPASACARLRKSAGADGCWPPGRPARVRAVDVVETAARTACSGRRCAALSTSSSGRIQGLEIGQLAQVALAVREQRWPASATVQPRRIAVSTSCRARRPRTCSVHVPAGDQRRVSMVRAECAQFFEALRVIAVAMQLDRDPSTTAKCRRSRCAVSATALRRPVAASTSTPEPSVCRIGTDEVVFAFRTAAPAAGDGRQRSP